MSQVKYKCKKSYPGGPVVGYILNPQDTWFAGMNYWWNNVWFDPKDYSEYWGLVREPIFTTEDCKEMFEGDKYYAVYSTWLCDSFNVSKSSPLSHTKNFSSRELADKYIQENKPQYSKKEMLAFTRYCGFHYEDVDRYFDDYIKRLKK